MKLGGVKKASNKTLAMVLASIGVLIVGVIIAIVVVLNIRSNRNDEDESVSVTTIEESPAYAKANKIYDETLEEIVDVIGDVPEGRKDLIIDTYNSYIAKVDNKLAKAMLNMERLYVEMNYDINGERGVEIKAAALEIDEVLQDTNSAGLILNVASKYGDEELYERYEKILDERGGVETGMESEE